MDIDLCCSLGAFYELVTHLFGCFYQSDLVRGWALINSLTVLLLSNYLVSYGQGGQILYSKRSSIVESYFLAALSVFD